MKIKLSPIKSINSSNGLNRRMEKVDPKSMLKLEDIFHKLARYRKKEVYGERKHAKFDGWHYKVEYDFWKKETDEDPKDAEILSFEGDEEFSFRNELKESQPTLDYTIRRAYFEESMDFLRTLDLQIAHTLIRRDLWSQADEKNTVVSTHIKIPSFNEIYLFIRESIRYTVKKH